MDSSHMQHSQESSLLSAGSQKTVVSRSHSDSSTISSKSNHAVPKANHSVDNIQPKNQLLKFSLLNSTSSPMKCQSLIDSSLAENVFAEAKKIAKQFADSRESSFEDLNNVSQPSEVGEISFIDPDLLAMNLKVPVCKSNNPQTTSTKPTAEKIADFQEQLKRIKKEVDSDNEDFPPGRKHSLMESTSTPVKVKVESNEDNHSELDRLLLKLRSVITDGNKDAAKKHLNRLNELLEKQKESDNKNTVNVVQPIVRQATFDIDSKTGKRKPTNDEQTQKTESDDIIEKLTKLLAGQTLNIHSISTNGEKLVLVVPSSVTTTPEKNSCKKFTPKAHSALKADKNFGTPMKRSSQVTRPGSFTTPRPQPGLKRTNLLDQKSDLQLRATGAARKSLMSSIDKSPQVQRPKVLTTGAVSKATTRRSVSMKASIPAVQVTKSSPMKSVPRPSTGAPYVSTNKRVSVVPGAKGRASTINAASSRPRTLSEHKKPVSQFKTPSALRKANNSDNNGSLV